VDKTLKEGAAGPHDEQSHHVIICGPAFHIEPDSRYGEHVDSCGLCPRQIACVALLGFKQEVFFFKQKKCIYALLAKLNQRKLEGNIVKFIEPCLT
jgi:hypothetical protein